MKTLERERKQISRKRSILNFALVAIIGIGSGLFLGSWYSYAFLSNTVDYSSFSESALLDNLDDTMKKAIQSNKLSDSDKQNWVQIAKEKGVTPKNLATYENVALAEYNLKNANSYIVYGTGKVETVANQTVYSVKYFDGTTYMFESISKGLISVADAYVMEKDANTVTKISGNNITSDHADWTGTKTTISTAEFKENNGPLPSEVFAYLISSKTTKSSSQITETTVDGLKHYSIEITLDPVTSVMNYVKQVKQTSGLADYPSFDNITLSFTIDENWNFVKFNIVENYRVPYGGLKPKCKGTLNYTFEFNTTVDLPNY